MPSVRRIAQVLAGALGGAAGAQFPAFFDQYLQSLGGRLDQALLQAGRITAAAHRQGLEVSEYVARLAASSEPVARAQAEVTAAALADAERLQAAYAGLSAAPAALRPVALARHLSGEVAAATLERFVPAVPLGLEGLIYAGFGVALGLGALGLGTAAARRVRRPPAPAEQGDAGHAR